MTNYLVLVVKPSKLTAFLEEIRDTRDLDKALQHVAGLTAQQFYDEWHAQLND